MSFCPHCGNKISKQTTIPDTKPIKLTRPRKAPTAVSLDLSDENVEPIKPTRKKSSKPLSQKQLDNLAKGRAIRLAKLS